MKKIKVNLEKKLSNSYDICIGSGIIDRAALILAKNNWASRYVVITDSNVAPLHADRLLTTLGAAGLKVDLIQFPAGESSKTIDTILKIVDQLLALGVDRKSGLIALGGGIVGDVTGFVASIYMRSLPYVQMATSLLAMVDASIGGKTGVDFGSGKNLLGTFYQPKAVFIDIDFIQTLPQKEFRTGLSEIIKYGIIDDAELFHLLEKEGARISPDNTDLMERLISRSDRIKKGIVEIDETEHGLRRILNFGHTLGHAIESESDYRVTHGEAVAIGMAAAARISEKMKYLSAAERIRIETIIEAAGLPVRVPAGLTLEGILSRIKLDKKKEGDKVPFVLIKKIGVPFINGGVPAPMIRETLEELRA